ncbi:MAG: hypothetical protein A2744_03455 [Candidatus Buchananbacteria bacterium RIFCSPHIGHO2_01_FULL_44_11]|uniref:O-antigen ligase-related domain-containing protein n=1 Tax=Candidatus Buchananbacteria bacterium RIFCSPHIGHO2_01_FULL_44_11 TaxID=1797535 RepID=A0A1G1Y4H8_9BACT|nr:MAG: hypothetical protein A2744_03455 [Candidatus Buchananbacteria bacterium RIFCSPHIGHO2_01_FULL_44_11]
MDFFTKTFWLTFFGLLLIELASWLGFLIPPFNQAVFLVILAATAVLSLIKIEYGLYAALTELFLGSLGYLFFWEINGTKISIRLGIFLVIFGAGLLKILKEKKWPWPKNQLSYAFLFLALVFSLGLGRGISRNDFSNVFFDVNNWFYFLLLPVFLIAIKKESLKIIGQILLAVTSWLSLKTICLLFLFSQTWVQVGDKFYHWLRDSGFGEITYIQGSLFRIFSQSQIYILIGFILALGLILASNQIAKTQKKWFWLYLYLTSLTLIISQSRSFWLGGLAGLVILAYLVKTKLEVRFKKIAAIGALVVIIVASHLFTIQLITGNFSGNLISDRFKDLESQAAASSRLNQLEPLISNIGQSPFFGYGFGKELTYQSNDPRILQSHPGGQYTTYAFEWGYLDIILKIGILGLAAYLYLIGVVAYQILKKFRISNFEFRNYYVGLLAGLAGLLVVNIFSPYLNHPLGIGYLLLLASLASLDNA